MSLFLAAATISIGFAESTTDRMLLPIEILVQVNANAWIPLNNNTVTIAEPSRSFGGIGGGSDESHCLTLREIRSEKDGPITCRCRDRIVEARYLYHEYLLPGKDRNLNGAFLAVQRNAQTDCGPGFDFLKAVETKDWKWNGPEVTRSYPSDRKIERISPDSRGFRRVEYKVRLTYRNTEGHTTKTEIYRAFYLELAR